MSRSIFMSNEEKVSLIALVGALIFGVHLIYRLGTFYKSHEKRDFFSALIVFNAAYHYSYIYLYYSEKLYSIFWLSGTEILNNYSSIIFYTIYVRLSVANKFRFQFSDIFSVLLLPCHFILFFLYVGFFQKSYAQVFHDYIAFSIPEAFPSINFILITFSSYCISIIINLKWLSNLTKNSDYIESSENKPVKGKSIVEYFTRLVVFTMGSRIGYSIFGWFGGRQWAIYYTMVDIIWVIAMVITHEIHPLLIKAKILQPATTSNGDHRNYEYDLQIKQKIISIMQSQKPYLDESFQLETLASLLGIKRNHTSAIINRCFGCSFLAFLHEYRITDAKQILENRRDVKPSLAGFEVGYKSMSAFYSAFRKKTGMSPQRYRESTYKSSSRIN